MKKIALLLAALFAVLQFVPAAPPKSNPSFDAAKSFEAVMRPPGDVLATLRRACFDCHSNETRWPAYSYVAPVSWLVQNHVADGRRHLNFSEWLLANETGFSDWSGFEKVCTEVRTGAMPMPGYVSLHPDAALSEADSKTVCAWVDSKLAGAR
ncbi:MAG: heme-binding protein [Acidobacteria bacterium]|nr:heme-binding protein [Acidobacteriota bacterium]